MKMPQLEPCCSSRRIREPPRAVHDHCASNSNRSRQCWSWAPTAAWCQSPWLRTLAIDVSDRCTAASHFGEVCSRLDRVIRCPPAERRRQRSAVVRRMPPTPTAYAALPFLRADLLLLRGLCPLGHSKAMTSMCFLPRDASVSSSARRIKTCRNSSNDSGRF